MAIDATKDVTNDEAPEFEPYREDENFVPNPLDIAGLVRTDGVTGADHEIWESAHVFDVAEARRRIVAARALDPESPVDRGLVILPGGNGGQVGDPRTDDEARALVADQAAAAVDRFGPDVVTPDLREGGDIAGGVLNDADDDDNAEFDSTEEAAVAVDANNDGVDDNTGKRTRRSPIKARPVPAAE